MTYTIELRGGPADGKRFTVRSLPTTYRVPEYAPLSELWTEPIEPLTTFRDVAYRPRGVRDDGTHIYAPDDHRAAMNDSLPWLRQQLDRYTYRPGWTMTLVPGNAGFLGAEPLGSGWFGRLIVEFQAVDSRDPTRTVPVRSTNSIPPYIEEQRDEDLFARWLQSVLFEAERHESQEWLRRDGQIYDDPHGR
jgi:hypothetical protein